MYYRARFGYCEDLMDTQMKFQRLGLLLLMAATCKLIQSRNPVVPPAQQAAVVQQPKYIPVVAIGLNGKGGKQVWWRPIAVPYTSFSRLEKDRLLQAMKASSGVHILEGHERRWWHLFCR